MNVTSKHALVYLPNLQSMTSGVVSILVLAMAALFSTSVMADQSSLLDEARKVASAVPPKLLALLEEEIAKGGPENAIGVCRETAPKMAKAASEKSGWNIRRVSLKNRNPKAVPDAWERVALLDFDKRSAAGESPAVMEKGEVVTEGNIKVYRYIKALPTQSLCVSCHGTPDDINPAVRAKLEELYPHDKAIGYVSGEIRGAITIKKPL